MGISGSMVVSVGGDEEVNGWMWCGRFSGGGRVDVDEED